MILKYQHEQIPSPDGMCGKTLRFRADQLSGVFRYLFQTSVDTCIIPHILKLPFIMPIPTKNNPKLLMTLDLLHVPLLL